MSTPLVSSDGVMVELALAKEDATPSTNPPFPDDSPFPELEPASDRDESSLLPLENALKTSVLVGRERRRRGRR